MKKSVIIVIGVLISVVILVNIVISNPTFQNNEDLIKYAIKSKQYSLAEDTYKHLIEIDSINNIDLCYGHLTSHFKIPKETRKNNQTEIRNDDNIYSFYKKKSESYIQKQQDIGQYGLGLYFSIIDNYESALEHFEKIQNKNLKYLNNSIGRIYIEKKEYELAEIHLLKEINNNGNLNGAYSNLIELYFSTNQLDKLDKLVNEEGTKYFSNSDLVQYYFKSAKFIKYIWSVLSVGFKNIDFQSFIAAILITLIWLFYLRKINIFHAAKWVYIVIAFILGIVLSYGTFFLSNITNYAIGFALNGNIFNDFMYCFLGIGLIEETMKLVPFLIILKFTKEVNKPIDYIIYTSVSALGFACAENILYLHSYGMEIIHGRALVSVVIHMFCSSIIGYGLYFGIGKIVLNKTQKIVLFLLIAALVHGFFDFWLINKTASVFAIFSTITLIIGISAWNSLINNSLNFSVSENQDVNIFNRKKIQDYLIYGLSSVLIFEYIVVSFNYGTEVGNSSLLETVYSGTYLIAFISTRLSSVKIRKNHKRKLFQNYEELDYIIDERLSFKKSYSIHHDILPCEGVVVERKIIQDEKNWYLVRLDKKICNYDVCADYVMIKIQNTDNHFQKGEKKTVAFCLIKNESIINSKKIKKRDLVFVGYAIAS